MGIGARVAAAVVIGRIDRPAARLEGIGLRDAHQQRLVGRGRVADVERQSAQLVGRKAARRRANGPLPRAVALGDLRVFRFVHRAFARAVGAGGVLHLANARAAVAIGSVAVVALFAQQGRDDAVAADAQLAYVGEAVVRRPARSLVQLADVLTTRDIVAGIDGAGVAVVAV